jgi:hypothetical protein
LVVFLRLWPVTDPLVTGRALHFLESGLFAPVQGFLRSSGKRRLAVEREHVLVVRQPRGKNVIHFLEPHKLGFQVADALLETAHFRDHTRVGTADVAE